MHLFQTTERHPSFESKIRDEFEEKACDYNDGAPPIEPKAESPKVSSCFIVPFSIGQSLFDSWRSLVSFLAFEKKNKRECWVEF